MITNKKGEIIMKKSLRFFLICTISIAVVFSIFSISNAQTSTELNMDDFLLVVNK